jgi:hypothetical protein
MNLKYLGDAFDHWKGSIIELLSGSLSDIHVDPMLTDIDIWKPSHFETYAKLLRVPFDNIIRYKSTYENIKDEWDLFLDPDTGIAPPSSCGKKHLCLKNINDLLPSTSKRLLLIYQHSFRKENYVQDKLNQIKNDRNLKGCHFIGYWSGNFVSMIFISRSKQRINKVKASFNSWLGDIASTRIICL